MNRRQILTSVVALTALPIRSVTAQPLHGTASVLDRIRAHEFQPTRDGFTADRALKKPGVASLEDSDWKVRTLAVRDLVKAGNPAAPGLIAALGDENPHVRYLSAMALGILRSASAVPALENSLREDKDSTVRSQAAIALGQIGEKPSLAAVRAAKADPDRDVQHQAELAAYALEHNKPAHRNWREPGPNWMRPPSKRPGPKPPRLISPCQTPRGTTGSSPISKEKNTSSSSGSSPTGARFVMVNSAS